MNDFHTRTEECNQFPQDLEERPIPGAGIVTAALIGVPFFVVLVALAAAFLPA